MNKQCPLCEMWYNDNRMNAMNLDAPLFRGYCYKCRAKLKADFKKQTKR